ncbi:MAG TPA: tRNA (adenosine(37)-N6)-dimethylallyltransferase MiaA [Egibacteraceae bacterium]|nr:tRNA (adenosine(37)-N6)-dimethylallyltransferase MiaA [Egibacteraceae bacterium]
MHEGGRVLVLVGPTASGKSAIAMQAAERLGAEIVAVDAFTVYRGMDVGTAKPSATDRARVNHHLVDVLDPSEECTVEWFQAAARTAIAEVTARGRVPLLVGGSGLYFRAVVDPLRFPPTDPGVRAEVEAQFADDPPAAHAALAAVDPAAAARIDPDNLRRSVRALEVHRLTGRPFSDWRQAWDDRRSIYPGLEVVGLDVPREDLSARIATRVEAMIGGGLVEECRRLLEQPLSATARQAIGYAELFDHLAGHGSLEEAAERIHVRTRRYAARQYRWFARDPRVRWVVPSSACEVLIG